ncbi:MAG: copper chaperone PCu(A)C, partial [Chromatocurvus sp.]
MYRIPVLFAVGAGLLLASGASADPTISGAWVRAMPPTQSVTAGYLTLENPGTGVITITGATADVSPRVEIHTTVSRDGMQRMQPVDTLDVAPGASIELAPGGYHLMLREMPKMPAEGDSVELCLELAGAQPVCTTA